jgi:hypothetical protein
VLVQRHRTALLDDRDRVAAHLGEPFAELLGVGHRRRQRHDRHALGEVDDHLLPHRTAEAVGQIVHLVHHHVAEAGEAPRAGVEHVAQHLGRHHHDRGVAVDGVVSGEQADPAGAVAAGEVGVLLVRQRLDRSRVEALATLPKRQVHGELAHQCLAGPGRRGHQHSVAVVERFAGAQLERVE